MLSADAQYRQAMINDLQATAVRYQDTVALYVAPGRGMVVAGATCDPRPGLPGLPLVAAGRGSEKYVQTGRSAPAMLNVRVAQ